MGATRGVGGVEEALLRGGGGDGRLRTKVERVFRARCYSKRSSLLTPQHEPSCGSNQCCCSCCRNPSLVLLSTIVIVFTYDNALYILYFHPLPPLPPQNIVTPARPEVKVKIKVNVNVLQPPLDMPLQLGETSGNPPEAFPGVRVIKRLEIIDVAEHHVCRRPCLSQ